GPAQRPGGNGQAHPRLRRRGRRPPADHATQVRPLMTSRPTEIGTARLSGRRDEPAAPETPPDSARSLPAPLTAEQVEDVRKAVINELHHCFDPEIPVNIYELGLKI